MKLSIYSIQNTLFEGEVERLTLPTSTGEITVLDGHIPLISLVNPGNISYTHSGTEKSLKLDGGVLEVRPENEAVILALEKQS
ncbi:MAG: F0F1 ATP synthase subunit epsilon [Candidatus Sungbacteria bacterium]|nr:F0F1 ATP synthase subunit epsilon [Candidatus Sungbacteria bacterium]